MRPLTILALALVLSGCGLGSIQDARNEYVKSTEKYDQCVAANPGAAERCEMLRQAMEADGRKYNEVSPNFLDQLSNRKDEKTAGQYNECLAANRGTPEKCETPRVAMENEKKFDWGGVFRPGTPPPDYANAQH
jgi:phage tail protein X